MLLASMLISVSSMERRKHHEKLEYDKTQYQNYKLHCTSPAGGRKAIEFSSVVLSCRSWKTE